MDNFVKLIKDPSQFDVKGFVTSKLDVLKNEMKYSILAAIVISTITIYTLGSSLFNLFQMNFIFKIIFTICNGLAILCWGLYYLNIKYQIDILSAFNPTKLLPSDVKDKLGDIELNTNNLFIAANIFSIPVYLFLVNILYKIVSKLF
jgi:hypothetical protein